MLKILKAAKLDGKKIYWLRVKLTVKRLSAKFNGSKKNS